MFSSVRLAHRVGALSDWERTKIFERYTTEYATLDIDEAKRTFEAARRSFWNALK